MGRWDNVVRDLKTLLPDKYLKKPDTLADMHWKLNQQIKLKKALLEAVKQIEIQDKNRAS